MNTFKRWSLASVVATYFLIFVGGLVRVSGAGLGCPDWPRCFGGWLPPGDVSQLPPAMDPSLFNFTLAWIEYTNRLVGVAIGICIAVTAVLAIKYYRSDKRVLVPSVAAAFLVAFQGWQGSRVVALQLKPHVVSLHFAIAVVIISLLVYVNYRIYWNPTETIPANGSSRATLNWLRWLWLGSVIQLILGTEVRGNLELMSDMFPLLTETELMRKSNYISYIHGVAGIIILGGTWFVYEAMRPIRQQIPAQVRNFFSIGVGLLLLQMIVGMLLIILGRPPILQIVHLWIASLFIGVLVILYSAFKTPFEPDRKGNS